MDILELRDYCLSFPCTEETTPFDETTLVYKVADKMFAMADMVDSDWVTVKCEPDRAVDLREEYEEITAAYHMNKRHWNTLKINGDLPAATIKKMISDSFILVVKGMPKAKGAEIMRALIGSGK